MGKYSVKLTKTVTAVIEVDASSVEDAQYVADRVAAQFDRDIQWKERLDSIVASKL